MEYLLRLGVGHIVAADGDRFDESNLSRQLYCTADNIGEYKVSAAAARAEAIAPEADFTAVCAYICEDNAAELIKGCAAVVDALDSPGARKLLAAACGRERIPFIHGAVGGWRAQASAVEPGSRALDSIYPGDGCEKATLPFMPAYCAAVQTAEAVKIICGLGKTLKGKLYTADLLFGESGVIELL